MSTTHQPATRYPLAEEIANSVSHGLGCVFAILGTGLLLNKAIDHQGSLCEIISYALYGGSMILLFLASTLYHGVASASIKLRLKKLDHCAIYLLIAGTYTPFLMIGLQSRLAYSLMGVIWSLALLGIVFKLHFVHRFLALSLITYLLMGWLSLVVIWQLATRLPPACVWLLVLGGIIYSLGVIFYANPRIPFNHAIWHGFVLAGAVSHFCAIYFYIG